jgi:hypothetical protein
MNHNRFRWKSNVQSQETQSQERYSALLNTENYQTCVRFLSQYLSFKDF